MGWSVGSRVLPWAIVAAASCATAAAPPLGTGGASAASGAGGASASSFASVGTGGAPAPPPIDEAGPSVDAGACAPFAETFTPSCLACLAGSCCPAALTCFASSDCFGFTNCQQNCPAMTADAGDPCLDQCTQTYPMAMPAYGAMAACLEASCPTVCPL